VGVGGDGVFWCCLVRIFCIVYGCFSGLWFGVVILVALLWWGSTNTFYNTPAEPPPPPPPVTNTTTTVLLRDHSCTFEIELLCSVIVVMWWSRGLWVVCQFLLAFSKSFFCGLWVGCLFFFFVCCVRLCVVRCIYGLVNKYVCSPPQPHTSVHPSSLFMLWLTPPPRPATRACCFWCYLCVENAHHPYHNPPPFITGKPPPQQTKQLTQLFVLCDLQFT